MSREHRPFLVAAMIVGTLYAGVTASLGRRFPPVNTDEVVRAVFGLQVVHHQPSRYTLYDDVFAPSVYPMRDVIPEVSLTLYHAWLGSWARLNPNNYRYARFSSVAAGALALLAFYLLGASLGGPRAGFLSVVLAAFNPLMLTASCIARPETLLLFTSAAILWLCRAMPDRIGLKPFVIGFLSLLQMAVHPNGSLVCLGVFIVYLFGVPRSERLSKGALFVAGAGAGLLAALAMVDARRLWLGMHTVHSALLRPPILGAPFRPFGWLQETTAVMWNAHSFYVDGGLSPLWKASVRSWWIGVALFWMAAAPGHPSRPEGSLVRPWGTALVAAFVAMVLLVKAKECLYGVNFLPFLVPVMAVGLSERAPTRLAGISRAAAGAAAVASVLLFYGFCRTSIEKSKPYGEIVQEFRALVPAGHPKIAAPSVLWFGWKDKENFRDSGAMLVSHWYTGKLDLDAWMGSWRPDILALDSAMQMTLNAPHGARSLEPALHEPVNFLGTIDAGPGYGSWDVYGIHWNEPDRHP